MVVSKHCKQSMLLKEVCIFETTFKNYKHEIYVVKKKEFPQNNSQI